MRYLATPLAVLLIATSFLVANAQAAEQTYMCPAGNVITTTEKGSQEKRKKTANLVIEEVPTTFSALPGWSEETSPQSLLQALTSNCKSRRLPDGWARVCADTADMQPSDVYAYIEENFTPYQLIAGDKDKGVFTSYYASYVNVDRNKSQKYAFPIYRSSPKALTLSRAEIEAGALDESEILLWTDSAFDAYILQVQGSGVGKLPDGSKVNIAYAGKNKKNYISLGKVLRECGEIAPADISLPSIRAWVGAASADAYHRLISNNQSYVFFSEKPYDGDSPVGALGVPLTPMRSLAVDTRYIPLGSMMYVAVPHPLGKEAIERVFIAQDKGGAISGGIRADIFAGEGEEAAEFAGQMAHHGHFWIVKPN